MRWPGRVAVLLLLPVAALAATSCQRAAQVSLPVHQRVGLSPRLHIDRIIHSMEGPSAETTFSLEEGGPRELVWITAYRTEVVDADGQSARGLSQFMCHNNLDFDSEAHRKLFHLDRIVNFGRMFTASQGVFEVVFPDGYGIPVFSDEPLTVNTMVLNHNLRDANLDVRHRITIDYVRDEDARGRLVPLYPTFAPVMALLQGRDGVFGIDKPSEHQHGASCAPGLVAPNAPEGTRTYDDHQGRTFTQHWVVPIGHEDRHTLVTKVLGVPFDTTLHYINAHLHPYARSLELHDLTTGQTLFHADARAPEQGIGLASVDHFSSAEGIPVFRGHDYEVESVYDNPTDAAKDAMAIFFVYFRDKEMEQRLPGVRQELAASGAAAASAAPAAPAHG
jgi:hypothetical protein